MVNFSAIAGTSLRQLLQGTIGNEVAVTVLRGEAEITSLLTISWREERQLRYEAWRRSTAEFVEQATDGRVGYIHIQGMNQPSLEVFERDLYVPPARAKALLLDVRNNGGGWTTDRVLASIMAPVHAWTTPRGADPAMTGHYPQDRVHPANHHAHQFVVQRKKLLQRGNHEPCVQNRGTRHLGGMPTHGSVISTGSFSLEDGTTVRMPFRGWYVADQSPRDMELNGAIPDLLIPKPQKMNPHNRHPTEGRFGRSPEEAPLRTISSPVGRSGSGEDCKGRARRRPLPPVRPDVWGSESSI